MDSSRPKEAEIMHGHSSTAVWSKELDKIKPPFWDQMVTKENLPDLKREWDDYAEKVQNIADIHDAIITPKSIYDCFEKKNLHYICMSSDLLPPELRGPPDQVKHATIHELVQNCLTNATSITRATKFKAELSRIRIDLTGKDGVSSIHKAWIAIIDLQTTYKNPVGQKTVIKILLKNLQPVKTREVIMALHDVGTQEQKQTKQDLQAFHDMLLDLARTQKRAIDFGLSNVVTSRATGLAATVKPETRERSKRPEKKSDNAIKHGGCKHHGPHAWHGTDECHIEHPELAPPGFNRERALKGATRQIPCK